MKPILILICGCCLIFMSSVAPFNVSNGDVDIHDQIRQIAINDFLNNKLYRTDSVFHVLFQDTIRHAVLKRIDKYHSKLVNANIYPGIIALTIFPNPNKFFLDTTMDISPQTRYIPSRCLERNGKLFFWYDKNYPLTKNAIEILSKYHLIQRGKGEDWMRVKYILDDGVQAADYYFCKSNLSVFKKVITSTAVGGYEPPKLDCK
jgi:hypothetical protein